MNATWKHNFLKPTEEKPIWTNHESDDQVVNILASSLSWRGTKMVLCECHALRSNSLRTLSINGNNDVVTNHNHSEQINIIRGEYIKNWPNAFIWSVWKIRVWKSSHCWILHTKKYLNFPIRDQSSNFNTKPQQNLIRIWNENAKTENYSDFF